MSQTLPDLVAELTPLRDEGGCIAWVCNTVGGAQETYQSLREVLAGSGVDVALFHARYPFAERSRREQLAMQRYGPHEPGRSHASILVATQVIEQSLDLDFDLLITELVPVDLVLQRAGRLHRYRKTTRPSWLRERTVWAQRPGDGADGLPAFGASKPVYGDYLLLRTLLALRACSAIRVPDDVEALVEAVYGHQTQVPNEPMGERLAEARSTDEALRRSLEDEAMRCLIGKPTFRDVFTEFVRTDVALTDDDNPLMHPAFRAMTRYSYEPSVSVVCLHQRGSAAVLRHQTACGRWTWPSHQRSHSWIRPSRCPHNGPRVTC